MHINGIFHIRNELFFDFSIHVNGNVLNVIHQSVNIGLYEKCSGMMNLIQNWSSFSSNLRIFMLDDNRHTISFFMKKQMVDFKINRPSISILLNFISLVHSSNKIFPSLFIATDSLFRLLFSIRTMKITHTTNESLYIRNIFCVSHSNWFVLCCH